MSTRNIFFFTRGESLHSLFLLLALGESRGVKQPPSRSPPRFLSCPQGFIRKVTYFEAGTSLFLEKAPARFSFRSTRYRKRSASRDQPVSSFRTFPQEKFLFSFSVVQFDSNSALLLPRKVDVTNTRMDLICRVSSSL